MKYTTKIILASLIALGLCAPTFAQTATNIGTATVTDSDNAVQLALHNAQFNFIEDLGFYVYDLNATLHPGTPSGLVDFDAPDEFKLEVHSGTVLVKPAALTTLFDRQVLAYNGAKMKNVTISTAQDELIVKGKVKIMGMWLPLTMKGPITLEDGQTLRMTPSSVKVLGIPMKSVMGMIGLKMGSMVDLDHSGVKLDGDIIRLKVFEMFPPPVFTGMVQAVRVTPKGMELSFVSQNPAAMNLPKLNSYVWMEEGQVRFFNIVIAHSHLLVQSEQPETPVEFFLYNYRDQIAKRGKIGMEGDGGITVKLSDK